VKRSSAPQRLRLAFGGSPSLEALFQHRQVARHLLSGFAADHQRNEHLANAVTLEVDGISTLERASAMGSTVTSTLARMGPSMPRTAHVLGGSKWVTSAIAGRLANPMPLVVTQRAPGAWTAGPSMWPSTTPFCHSPKRVGSVA